MMTGVPPGWHGITGFFRLQRPSWKTRLMTAEDLEYPRIWEALDIESLIVNPVPETPIIPARRAKILSWFLYRDTPASYPRSLSAPLEGMVNPRIAGCHDAHRLAVKLEAILGILEESDPARLAWVTLRVPDQVFHKCPEALDDPGRIERILRVVDGIAGILDDNYDDIIIVSDHGFARYKAQVSVNDILARHGLTTPAGREDPATPTVEGVPEARESKTMFIRVPPAAYRLVHRLHLAGAARTVLGIISRLAHKKLEVEVSLDVDLEASKAALIHDIDHQVATRVDPNYVARILSTSWGIALAAPTSRAFQGPYHSRSGDVLVLPDYDSGIMLASRHIRGLELVRTPYHTHHPNGVVYATGEPAEMLEDLDSPVENTMIGVMLHCLLTGRIPVQSPEPPREWGCKDRVDYRRKWVVKKRIARALASRARAS